MFCKARTVTGLPQGFARPRARTSDGEGQPPLQDHLPAELRNGPGLENTVSDSRTSSASTGTRSICDLVIGCLLEQMHKRDRCEACCLRRSTGATSDACEPAPFAMTFPEHGNMELPDGRTHAAAHRAEMVAIRFVGRRIGHASVTAIPRQRLSTLLSSDRFSLQGIS